MVRQSNIDLQVFINEEGGYLVCPFLGIRVINIDYCMALFHIIPFISPRS